MRRAAVVAALALAITGCQAPTDAALPAPGAGSALAVAPDNLATLWLVTPDGTFRSPDGGHSWFRIARLTSGSVAFTPAGALVAPGGRRLLLAATSGSGGLRGGIRTPAVLVSISSPWYLTGRVYGLDAAGRLWHSHDGGRHWRRSPGRGLPPGAVGMVAALWHRGRPDVLYVAAGRRGVWASFDSGASFRRVSAVDAVAVAATPARFGLLLVAGSSGLWRSTDAGAGMRRVAAGRGIGALALDPWNWRLAYASGGGDLLRSIDGGAHWSPWPG
ncbi:MAG TPA: hypothetical protein VMU66_05900 [Gaiellales bacterium]|nr:hypothetical protein [Gaiellales bacterium]